MDGTADLLIEAARRVEAQVVSRARTRTGRDLRPAHAALLAHVDHEGTRLTELARRSKVSKQAIGQLVDELEAMGILERVDDPTDRRAKKVRFGRRGRRSQMGGEAVMREIEGEIEGAVGSGRLRDLERALRAVIAALG